MDVLLEYSVKYRFILLHLDKPLAVVRNWSVIIDTVHNQHLGSAGLNDLMCNWCIF